MAQHNIESILAENRYIPVATIDAIEQVDTFYNALKTKGVSCIEITLRTPVSWEAIRLFKEKYGHEFSVGVGTIKSANDIQKCQAYGVDFMVSPGLTWSLFEAFEDSGIPYLPGVSTPSEIIQGLNWGLKYFKFFPADLFGGAKALKAYGGIFQEARFCPTGGINEANAPDFLALDNVVSVGGSWLLK